MHPVGFIIRISKSELFIQVLNTVTFKLGIFGHDA